MQDNKLTISLKRQKKLYENSVILNPTENFPLNIDFMHNFSFLHGLYVTDKIRDNIKELNPKVIFSGRNKSIKDVQYINEQWAIKLGGKHGSLRLLSGLHAYVTIFMSIGNIGDKIMVLPENAGGHFSVSSILDRLGYKIIAIPVCNATKSIDIKKTNEIIENEKPKFLLIDRSEGLNYEDFTKIDKECFELTLFDASQYLSNIIAGHFKHPFEMGFDCIIATIHKNFPGPQKALVVFKESNIYWQLLEERMGVYISNTHIFNTYLAGLAILNQDFIIKYSKRMLENSEQLFRTLQSENVSVVPPQSGIPYTHHAWITTGNKYETIKLFKDLEWSRIHTNYRLLPYELGHGLRLGTSWATLHGMDCDQTEEIGKLISAVFHHGRDKSIKRDVTRVRRDFKAIT